MRSETSGRDGVARRSRFNGVVRYGKRIKELRRATASGIQRGWSGVKRNLTEAAANMPEEHYLLEPNPNQRKDQELLNKSKAEFVAALAASFAYCDPIYLALTDQSAVELVKQGNNMVARGYLLANNVAHSREMYGTSAVYMRLANMVPPSTERRTRSRPR